ncbi:MAG: CheR family methyltransferase [Myxococcaceae bacterium]
MAVSRTLVGALRRVYRFLKWDVFEGMFLLAYGRVRHRQTRAKTTPSNSHCYTCFFRSPPQLDVLTGPVVQRLGGDARELRFVVFAASNGAEPYTFASELIFRRPGLRFHIRASDLHPQNIEKARSATYTRQEITQGVAVPEAFIARTFDRTGDAYTVKASIRERVSFEQADLLDPALAERFAGADVVAVQNVLFHMPPELSGRALQRIRQLLRPGSVLLLEGMDLDQRVAFVRETGLVPLSHRVREIHQYSRFHIPFPWWRYPYGAEPYTVFAANRRVRYGTIFEMPRAPVGQGVQ